jgi:putative drug exporter of the RND superfamily
MKLDIQDPPKQVCTENANNSALSHRIYRFGFGYGRFIHRIRWIVIVLWIGIIGASVPFTTQLMSALTGGGFSYDSSESVKANNLIAQKLNQSPSQIYVVFQSASALATDPSFQQEVTDFTVKAEMFDHVSTVVQGGIGKDQRSLLLIVNFDRDSAYMSKHLADFHNLVPTGASANPAKVYLTGSLATYDEFTTIATNDMEQADVRALPIALIVLLFVFGTIVAGLLPIMLAIAALPVALALIYLLAQYIDMSSVVLSVSSIIGLGLSIDYTLFMVRRFREELASGKTVQDAVGWTIATAGEAILFSGFAVIVGFLGMLLIGVDLMTAIGLAGVAVVLCAAVGALTLVPALLSVIGTHINALRLPFIGKRIVNAASQEQSGHGLWHALATGVTRRPWIVIVTGLVVLLAIGSPLLQIQIGTPNSTALPANSDASRGLSILYTQFDMPKNSPIYAVVQTPDGSDMMTTQNLERLELLGTYLRDHEHIIGATSLLQLPSTSSTPAIPSQQLIALYTSGVYKQNPALTQLVTSTTAGDTTLVTLQTDTTLDSPSGKALIDSLRQNYGTYTSLKVSIGGTQAVSLDFTRYLYTNFPRAILFIVLMTYLLLLLMFRSILLPLKAVIVNMLSIGAAYGVIVAIFQWGWLHQLLGFTSEGYIESPTPIIMFCVLFGLSMDYEVFLLSRIREEWLQTHNNRYAVVTGLEKTGSVITSAAMLLMIVASSVALTSLVPAKEVGWGVTIAIFIDATIIRTLLVPVAMKIIGRWCWWLPGRPIPIERPLEA